MQRAAQLILAGLVAALLPAAPAAAADRDCFWAAQDDPTLVNVAYPDAAAGYWLGAVTLPPGARMELRGRYPHARYMSLNVYDQQLAPTDGLADVRIVPDAGSINPMEAGADRTTDSRSYTVSVVSGVAPAQRAPNTIYMSAGGRPSPAGTILYRVYVRDRGRDDSGDMGLPQMSLVLADGRRLEGARACEALDRLRVPSTPNDLYAGASLPAAPPPPLTGPATDPVTWALFLNAVYSESVWLRGTPLEPARGSVPQNRSGGFLSNVDNQYVSAIGHRGFGPVLVLEGRAPVTPPTQAGDPVMRPAQLRYWSLCSNERASTRLVGCLFDEQVPVTAEGRYTVVVSQPADRPSNARPECGVAWLAWGAQPETLVILRHMLPDPGFEQAVQRVPAIGAERATMGDHLPTGRHMSTGAFEQRGCG